MISGFLLSIVCSIAVLNSLQIPTPLLRDVRSVHDIGSISFELSRYNKSGLILADIVPDEFSGDAIARGMYIDAKTGKLVKSEDSKFETVVSGSFTIISQIVSPPPSPAIKHDRTYKWIVPETPYDREDIEYYSPFYYGGEVLCGLNEHKVDPNRFGQVYLLPKDWKAYALPAFRYVKQNGYVFNSVKPNLQKLVLLVNGKNPILSIWAYSLIVQSKGNDIDYIVQKLPQQPSPNNAFFLYLAIKNIALQKKSKSNDLLIQLMKHKEKYFNTKDYAVAGAAAYGDSDSQVKKTGKDLLLGVKAMTNNDPNVPDDVKSLLYLTGIN